MCDVLNIQKSTYYYAYLSGKDVKKAEDIEISKEITRILKESRHNYATRKIKKELEKLLEPKHVSRRRIGRLMNELALVFDRMGIDSKDVTDAMNTKWNALGFTPGLVGGHCIGVDPYYFVYEAENLGYHSQIIKSGREINDGMGEFIADKIIKGLIKTGKKVIEAKVVVLGLTFKENTPDTRNSKVGDILKRLTEYDIKPEIVDPWASERDALKEYGVTLSKYEEIQDADCVVLAVGHEAFKALTNEDIEALYNPKLTNEERVLVDIKSILDHEHFTSKGYAYWRL
ncbi:IS3 family transposase [Aerococcaceae bacterium DSM 109653]|uniref:IS3 family transposase n=2 Tax=Fundicoccus ignavus TaxID=2664442 RepID=A0A844BRV3_9LACT|nr:IS3 family transposase [Fundicoccus ignavus]